VLGTEKKLNQSINGKLNEYNTKLRDRQHVFNMNVLENIFYMQTLYNQHARALYFKINNASRRCRSSGGFVFEDQMPYYNVFRNYYQHWIIKLFKQTLQTSREYLQ